MRSSQTNAEGYRRATQPGLESLDRRWMPSAVAHPITPAATTIAIVDLHSPRPDRLESGETAKPRAVEASRPRVAPRPLLPASAGPGPQGDAGGPDPDDPEQQTVPGPIGDPADRAEAHDVAIALLSEDPQLRRARVRHAPRPLLPDEQAADRGKALDPLSPTERPRAAGVVIPPLNGDGGIAATNAAAPSPVVVDIGRPTVAIVTRSRPASELASCDEPVAAASPAEASTPASAWAIVLAGLAPAGRMGGEAVLIHARSRGEGRRIHP